MKGVCQGPNDELTLLTSNCPCGRERDRQYETDSGQLTGSACPYCKTALFFCCCCVASSTRLSLTKLSPVYFVIQTTTLRRYFWAIERALFHS
eukprot:COSAG02_NODE_1090_length_14647_cov_122.569425_4_plen_93_part_00